MSREKLNRFKIRGSEGWEHAVGDHKTLKLVDVAREAGVSQGTASNVFNKPHLVRDEVRERVHSAARRLGYRGPDPKGRLLRAGSVNAIGVATSSPLTYFFEDPFARAMMSAISRACEARGAGIALVSAASEEALAWNIKTALVDGFILFCLEEGPRLVELTRERALPFVTLELGSPDETIPGLGIDNYEGGRLAGDHIGALGHRQVAILALEVTDAGSGPLTLADIAAAYPTAQLRAKGYLDGLAAHGVDPAAVAIHDTANDAPSVVVALEALFAATHPPTAILAMSDAIALHALDWLKAHGLSVPGEVSVVGFDGVPETATSEPPLTTIVQPIDEMGRQAADMILSGKAEGRRVLVPTLAVRASTARPK